MRRKSRPHQILLTAGPTREPLDPVRYLSNHSSGEMGLTLASALARSGQNVTVVLGPVTIPVPKGITVVPVTTAREMSAAVRRRLPKTDAFIATAAVCDWRPALVSSSKMKKGRTGSMALSLVANPDILAEAGRWKGRGVKPALVGFALETNQLERYAKRKMNEKNLDLIIGNGPDTFSRPTIKPLWIERDRPTRRLPRLSKKTLSSMIARWLLKQLHAADESSR